jgi:AcrR family transcriptional regulator
VDRHDISDIAIDLFRRNGYEQVTVQDICDACGISKPTFYSRFSSKGDILLDFYEDVSLRLNDNLSALMGTTSAWEQLRICFETLMDETESVGYELMSHTLAINLSEDHHSFDERPYLARTMSTIIDRGQRMGEFANSQPAQLLYKASAYLFQGHLVMWCIRKGEEDWRNDFLQRLHAVLEVKE